MPNLNTLLVIKTVAQGNTQKLHLSQHRKPQTRQCSNLQWDTSISSDWKFCHFCQRNRLSLPSCMNESLPTRNIIFQTQKCFKWAYTGLFFAYFWSYKANNTIFYKSTNIWHWESNSQTLDFESLSLTTKPGLPPNTEMFQSSV